MLPSSSNAPPHFIIIGAMKCATSTLHDQLAQQPGIFMSEPKEPCFFSDDPIWEKGEDWYASLFAAAEPNEICGESSTHYTKLPTYPQTVSRLKASRPNVRLIYVMRHPIDRLISQYIHQWTENEITIGINAALQEFPELVAYSQYGRQLDPFFDAFGREAVLPVFFEYLLAHPQQELERICRFVGYAGNPVWQREDGAKNVSQERLRESRWRDRIVYAPGISQVRQYLVPQGVRDRIKQLWQIRQRPTLDPENLTRVTELLDADLARVGGWLGQTLTCANFKTVAAGGPYEWTDA